MKTDRWIGILSIHFSCCMEGNLIEIGSWNKPYEDKDLMEG